MAPLFNLSSEVNLMKTRWAWKMHVVRLYEIPTYGDGTIGGPNGDHVNIDIPDDLLLDGWDNPIASIVDSTYPTFSCDVDDTSYLQGRAILAPTLDVVDQPPKYFRTKLSYSCVSHTRMAQLQAFSSCSSTNLLFHGSKRDTARIYDKVQCSRKALLEELWVKASEFHGHAIVPTSGNYGFTRNNCAIQPVMASNIEPVISSAMDGKVLRKKLNKVVLAYSGGLDTSVIVPWLRENYGCEVVCFTADVGQGIQELEGLEQKAKASGASQLVVKDLKEEFVKDFIFPCLRAGAIYERKYLLGTSMARPVIAKAMVDAAREVGADAVSHGCTGKGNDQVRFELTFFALNPELSVVAPWREWEITGREDAIEYAKKHNVPVPVTKKSIYSRDRNLWHLSHEGDILEDPANEPKEDMYMMSVDPKDAPNQPEYVKIGIVEGLPISLNGKKLSPASLLSELNEVGGRHGIGRIDMVENRLVGMKSRGVYETPGGTILFAAARELESLTLDRETMQIKDILALKYAELVYAGRWFDPLRESMDAFMKEITKTTTGSVTLKLFKGSVNVTGRESPYSLYREDISSFESGQIYDQADAAGFIRLYGLPMRVRAMLEKGL
ncbi:Argininosuccinate synthase [Abeliophyllum distichum]|uniref:argininosuccinate synthase n=1 Tax=Abeliophyllum distichum TaxID=126358 RepID=A0ABD1SYI7_9LAMI